MDSKSRLQKPVRVQVPFKISGFPVDVAELVMGRRRSILTLPEYRPAYTERIESSDEEIEEAECPDIHDMIEE